MLDIELMFDTDSDHLTTEASLYVVDLNSVRNIGAGQPLYIESVLKQAMTDAGSDSTMTLTVETDDNDAFSSPTTVQTIGTFPATSAAGTKLSVGLAITDAYERYLRVQYTVANGDLTTGKFSTYITLMPSVDRIYPAV